MRSLTDDLGRSDRHSRATRLFHTGLALAVISQLLTSLVMRVPGETRTGDLFFQVHQYSGLLAAGFALGFWLIIAMRSRGTELGALLPWASKGRRATLWADIRAHAEAAKQLRLPDYDPEGALASAVHGLGLLLVSVLAASGAAYFVVVWLGFHSPNPDGLLMMEIHGALANLGWAYLIGHAGLAVLHHLLRAASLTEMWSFRR